MCSTNDKITRLFRECKTYENRREKYEIKKTCELACSEEVSNMKNVEIKVEEEYLINDDSREFLWNDLKTLENEVKKEYLVNIQSCELFSSDLKSLGVNEVKKENLTNEDPREILLGDLKALVAETKMITASIEFSSLSKMMALVCFAAGDEVSGIGHLIESHAVILQQHIYHRYKKTQVRHEYLKQIYEAGLNPAYLTKNPKSRKDSLCTKLAEMPDEWYMIQVTVAYEEPEITKQNGSIVDSTRPLHITVLPTGKNAISPFCITLPKPKNDEYDGFKEIVEILSSNKSDLQAYYANNKSYWKMREKQNNRMKVAVMDLEFSWLREWRILLMADPLENSSLVNEMRGMIDKLIADDLSVIHVSPRSRWLLRKIATCSCFLTKVEMARAVYQVIGDKKKLADNIILSIHGKLQNVHELRMERRKTLIMIVDESIDHVPFESMEILKNHPVTRFPSFNIAYAMFKEHENTIVKGCKVVQIGKQFGTFIVNPARNLDKMEKRLKIFIDYWLPHWEGTYGREPDENTYEEVLVNNDVLVYAGHGSGIQYLPGEKIEKLRVRSTVLLFGCCSVKLFPMGGRFPPYGISNQYLIACSPCVLGTLWEVTDGDIDKMTARFLSNWIPSNAERNWDNVDINTWADGTLKFKKPVRGALSTDLEKPVNEPELLRAVAESKEICTQHMTSAAIVVRGLPIRLE